MNAPKRPTIADMCQAMRRGIRLFEEQLACGRVAEGDVAYHVLELQAMRHDLELIANAPSQVVADHIFFAGCNHAFL